MPDPLPRPEVVVTTESERTNVVVSRDGKARSYVGEGRTEAERTQDVVKRVLDDPHSAEYVRRG